MQSSCRIAFVTGAAQGLGKAFSEALLQRGTKVCLADVQENKGRQVENDFKSRYGRDNVAFFHCDVSSDRSLTDSFKAAVSKFGHIDLMVNNAGIADESRFKDMVNINLIGAVTGTQLALEHMRKDKGGKGGKIINVASTAGLTGVYFVPLYCTVKFGLVGFHKSCSEITRKADQEIYKHILQHKGLEIHSNRIEIVVHPDVRVSDPRRNRLKPTSVCRSGPVVTYVETSFPDENFAGITKSNPHLDKMGVQFGCLCPAFTDTAIMEFDKKKLLYFEEALEVIKKIGTNKVETVVEAFIQLVETANCNGDIMTVTAKDGIQYKHRGTHRQSRM